MTFKVKCNWCNCTFNVDSERMPKKTGICCPNCEAKLSDASFKKLQEACFSFDEAARMVSQQPVNDSGSPAFTLSIKEN